MRKILAYGSWWLVRGGTVQLHPIHHSRPRVLHDTNYGGVTPLWDRGDAQRADMRKPG